jgi:uncharacterized phage protein gp47/JayE
MPGPYPLPYLGVTVDETGASAPPFVDILESFNAKARSLFGSDIYIEPDSQDGQQLGIFSKAIDDNNKQTIATYQAYSPEGAIGANLSSLVKLNGLRRLRPTNSQADLLLVGTNGTQVINGLVGDGTNTWVLPSLVIIPESGQVLATAVCAVQGAVAAPAGTITDILTSTPGWQTVTNPTASTVGRPVETDAALRVRRAISVAFPSLSVLDGLLAAVAQLEGVKRLAGYENKENVVDANGIPAKSIAVVVDGGSAASIAGVIARKKTPGTGTFGSTAIQTTDRYGVPSLIGYFPLTTVKMSIQIQVKPLYGWVSSTLNLIEVSVQEFINEMAIGEWSYLHRLFAPANLRGDEALAACQAISPTMTQAQLERLSNTFNITQILQGRHAPKFAFDLNTPQLAGFDIGSFDDLVTMSNTDVPIFFNEAAAADLDAVTATTV